MKLSARSAGLDIVRCVAVICVLAVHFMEFNGYFNIPLVGFSMIVLTLLRSIFLCCIPLFFLIMGYLGGEKTPTLKYYKKLLPLLFSYVVISIFFILIKIVIFKETYTFLKAANLILSFNAISYAWYFLQYIPLFLIAPFLNVMYNGVNTKKNEQLLIFIFLLLTIIPTLINLFLAPHGGVIASWQSIYPATYYIIGLYIKKHLPSINKIFLTLIIFGTAIIQTLFNYYHSNTNVPDRYYFYGYYQWSTAIIAIAIFLLLYKCSLNSLAMAKLISTISTHSLEIFLFSAIFDVIFYNFYWKIPTEQSLFFFIPTIMASLIICLMLALLKDLLLYGFRSIFIKKKK